MSSHSAKTLHDWRALDGHNIEATITLACGCRITRAMRADRLQEAVGGGVLIVGKFPCPLGHPVLRPE